MSSISKTQNPKAGLVPLDPLRSRTMLHGKYIIFSAGNFIFIGLNILTVVYSNEDVCNRRGSLTFEDLHDLNKGGSFLLG